jgi:hypothetical protein
MRLERKVAWILGGCVVLLAAKSCGGQSAAVERVAAVEHEQWTEWSKSVAPEVSPARRARWQKYWVPYKDLPEDVKELDRAWARKAIQAAKR